MVANRFRGNKQCDGDKSQVCGGALRLSVYQQGTATSGGSDLTRVPLTLCAGALLLAATSLVYGLA